MNLTFLQIKKYKTNFVKIITFYQFSLGTNWQLYIFMCLIIFLDFLFDFFNKFYIKYFQFIIKSNI